MIIILLNPPPSMIFDWFWLEITIVKIALLPPNKTFFSTNKNLSNILCLLPGYDKL